LANENLNLLSVPALTVVKDMAIAASSRDEFSGEPPATLSPRAEDAEPTATITESTLCQQF